MERINVNTVSAMDGRCSTTEECNTDQFEQGQVVEGVITKVSDTISITLNGKELQVSQSAVQNAKEGQVRTFEITDISKQSIVLREVGNDTEQAAPQGVRQTSVMTGDAAFTAKLKDSKSSESLDAAKEKLRKQIASTLNRFSEEDYAEMEKESTPLEEYNEDRFERTLDRIKEQKQFKKDHLGKEIEKKQDTRESLEESTKNIKERLEDQNLPATDNNIAKVANAMELAAMSSQMTDASKAYMIENSLSVTPENIYKSIYSGNYSASSSVTDATWNELQPQVEELLAKDGVEMNEQTLADAKWLLQNDLTISKDTLATLGQLNAIAQEQDPSLLMELCIKNLAEGGEPKATNLYEQMEDLDCIKKAMDSVRMLEEIKDSAVESLTDEEPVTLDALRKASESNVSVDALSGDIKAITARRQLEEVRLKLTMESSYQLFKQGIDVNTTELSNLVEGLRALEDTYYKGLCEEIGVNAGVRETGLLKATDQMAAGLKGMPATLLGSTFSARDSITMAELYAEGEKEQAAYANKSAEYETLMTAPRKDLGDSIKKAFNSVDNILEDLNMEQTESNERAVRILAYNQMEINEASITDMKSYDLQVNQLMNAMTPEVALTLIKEGKNPIDLPIRELTEQVMGIASSLGETSEEKFSEYLYNLDQKNSISSEERESYIGIYRLLHQVEKSDGAAVGAVVKADQELTLSNLLTAVRSSKQTGMDIKVNETFGGVERIQTNGASISEQVGKAFYGTQLAKEVFDGLLVDTVAALQEEKDSILDTTLEEFYEKQKEVQQDATSEYTAKKYDTMRNVLKDASQSDVLVSAGLEVSVNRLEAAGYLLAGDSSFYKDVKEKASAVSEELGEQIMNLYSDFEERLADETSLQDGYQRLSGAVKDVFEEYMHTETVTEEDTNSLRIYQNVIRLASDLSKSRRFEIPVTLGDEVVNMKVQMLSSQDGASKVAIHMEDENLGAFDVTAAVEEGSLSAFIMCDNRELMGYYDKNQEQIRESLEQTGVTVKQFTITMNRKKTEFYDNSAVNNETAVSSETLYKIAKIFVTTTKKAFE